MEKLSRYLAKHNMKPTAFAKRLGVAPSTVIRILNGERKCGFGLAKMIETETGGAIKAASIVADRLRSTGEAA